MYNKPEAFEEITSGGRVQLASEVTDQLLLDNLNQARLGPWPMVIHLLASSEAAILRSPSVEGDEVTHSARQHRRLHQVGRLGQQNHS